jgi:hypothetical protein
MKKFLFCTAVVLCGILTVVFSHAASAQTLALNDGAILQSNTNRVGVNLGAIDYWDQGQILKNLIGSSNPGMEPLQDRQIWSLAAAGSSSTFTIPDIYDTVSPNYWVGGNFTVVESQNGGPELGCTGTIAANTGPNYPVGSSTTWVAPTITVSSPCAAAFNVGDIIILSKTTFPTPETWWETGGRGGTAGTASGGAQLLSDTTDLCPTCGTQALNLNASVSGSIARAQWGFDGEWQDNVFIVMNGTYQLTFWAKAASGNPVLTASASRGSVGGFNCGSYTPTLTSSWAQYTWTCTASESAASVQPASGLVAFSTKGGSVYLDNVSFQKISGNPTNTTVLRDEVIETLQKFYGPSVGKNPGTLRYWVNQNAETIGNWTQPDYAHMPTSGGTGYFVSPGGMGTETLSLEDYLVICKFLNASPYLEIPVTLTTTDAANLVEFLAGPSSSTYGARRAALGQSQPWTSVFSTIHLSFCNECWNGQAFAGQALWDRSSQPNSEYYYDYSVRTRDIFAAMRADQYYTPASLDLVMNAQTAADYTMDIAIQRAHPDSIEIEDYTYGGVSSFSTDAALWGPAMVDPYEKVTNPQDIRKFYQSVHDYQSQKTCGPTGTSACKVNIYEWGQGTISGGIDQTHLDYINAGAGEGVIMALQPLLNMQYYGIMPQSFFSLSEYKNSAADGMTSKLWGNVIDMGGATNNVRPTFMGVQLINQSIIGSMYACPINNNATYNFPGSPNGNLPMPAMTNVPYLYAFCFENGTQRSLVLLNTDLTSSHTISFGGTNPPFGSVTVRQYAPSDLDEMNEAPTGTATNLTQATSAIETSSLSSPTSITLPPFSATALDYTAQGLSAAAMPTFSPVAGTYTTAQPVSINDTTAGTTLYYTTDGSTPTTSSTKYSGPITISGNKTLQAIAVASGYAISPAASGAYVIAPVLPTPTFSVAAGTYSTTQSIAISEATAGTTIYYTTNGSTPTTSSTKYSGPVSISSTETLNAIAAMTGFSNSQAATALYTIAPALPAVTFSPAPGTFTSAMSVSLAEAQAGAVIRYTTDGSTPTAASTQYGGPLWISSTETLKAIAVLNGYTNSTSVTGTFTIAPVLPAPTFSPSTGIFTATTPVTISDSTAGTTVYYTTDGSTPTTSSNQYTGPVQVAASETLNAIAVKTGYSNSKAGSAAYTINSTLSMPTFSHSGGIYIQSQSVAISDLTSGAAIYYTTDGSTPTTASTKYSGALTVSTSETLKAIAVMTGHVNSAVAVAAFTINGSGPAAPVFSVPAGSYSAAQTVSITGSTSGAVIYYTTNGSAPTTASTKYAGPVTVSTSETLQAIAVLSGANSAVSSAAYTIVAGTLPAPVFSVPAGTYPITQSVAISDATAGATIYYTTNGTAPTTASAKYSVPISVTASETLTAIAVKTGSSNSPAASAAYKINATVPAPTFSPAGGSYTTSQVVTISEATKGTNIYYTTDGSTPSASSIPYTSPITVTSTETLKAIAIANGDSNAVGSATYTITLTLAAPTFSVASGTYTSAQSVAISDATAGTTIYFTTNGSTPTTSSTKYSAPITVSATETLEAIAVKTGYSNSPAASAAYSIGAASTGPTFSPAPGTYTSAMAVTISDSVAGAIIYYTTDGTTPTTSSTHYGGPLWLSTTQTLKAIAVKSGTLTAAVPAVPVTATYTIAHVLPTPTFAPNTGIFTATQSVTISDSTAGTTIYYTTDGSTPTTSSAKYTGPVTVSASEALHAIAVKTGSTNSLAGNATYTINNVLSAPTFSHTTGIYVAAQTIAITDATAGATIYYTTNGTTPTTSSAKYTSPIVVSTSETVQAIAVASGHVNSPVGTAKITITGIAAVQASK